MTSTVQDASTVEKGSPRSDPRTDPRLLAALATYGLDGPASGSPLTRSDEREVLLEAVGRNHAGFNGLYEAMPNELPGDREDDVTTTTRTVEGADGTQVTLHVTRPVGVDGPLPGVAYVHGGGMVILETQAKVHQRWRHDLALAGTVAVGVDFRNAWTAEGVHPFPTGLDDCVAATRWLSAHREELGLSSLVLQGESGGANLVLATALRANREGWVGEIDGVYAIVPYISGGYGWDRERKLRELPSLVHNDGYFIECSAMDLLVWAYDPDGSHAQDPLAWPHFATEQDMAGLPPHVVTVDELDPLCDEGTEYYRRLVRAGVPAAGKVNLGLTHAAELIYRQALPDVYRGAVRDIAGFARSLAR